jgi:hypothetical protein
VDEGYDFGILRQMLRCALNLNDFLFIGTEKSFHTPSIANDASPIDVIWALMPQRSSLRTLNLAFNARCCFEGQLEDDDLKEFTNLKILDLSDNSFCRHFFEYDSSSEYGDETSSKETCLVGLLPPTVKFLQIGMTVLDSWPVFDDLKYLSRKIRDGHFRELRVIRISCTGFMNDFSFVDWYCNKMLRCWENEWNIFEGLIRLEFAGLIFHDLKAMKNLEWMNLAVPFQLDDR